MPIEGERMNIKISISVDGNNENKKVFEFDNQLVIDETMQTILKDGFGFQPSIQYIYSMRWIGNHFLDSQSTFFVIHRCHVI